MIHDSLCPVAAGPCCPWMGDCDCQCNCDLIARVRADEREQAERAIYKNCAHTKYEGCKPCWHDLMVRDLYGDTP